MEKITAIDLFCGFGGVTEGFEQSGKVEVICAINHDPLAIECHSNNHPHTKHFVEDIVTKDISDLPRNISILHSSLECTNFSNAKGGASREADSRSLPHAMYRYISHCNPDYFTVENVREFMSWGPLTEKRDKKGDIVYRNGKPVMIPESKTSGSEYLKWVQTIKNMGYDYDYRLLNSADFGSPTRRIRYYGVFAKHGLPIKFPSPTHLENPGMFGEKKWVPVSECLNLENEGNSIFGRKKPLVDATLARIAYGIKKYYVGENEDKFISAYYGTGNNVNSVNLPLNTITTKDRHLIVDIQENKFITNYYTRENAVQDLQSPINTITTVNNHNALVTLKEQFITQHIHGCKNASSVHNPLPTILTKDLKQMITVKQTSNLKDHYKNDDSEKYEFFKQYFSEELAFVLNILIEDIKMRFLDIDELLTAQGFDKKYQVIGNKAQKTKFIGNSVPPQVPKALAETIYEMIQKHKNVA